jgi:hypothetical protein
VDELEVESRHKERRSSASPPAVPRQPRPQRLAAQNSVQLAPLAAESAPALEELAAVFDASVLTPAIAATVTASCVVTQKICVQCGTSEWGLGVCRRQCWPAVAVTAHGC